MQWVAISTLLSQIDFSKVTLGDGALDTKKLQAAAEYSKAQAEAEKAAVEEAAAADLGDNTTAGSENEGAAAASPIPFPKLDISFSWPHWFQGTMAKVTALSQLRVVLRELAQGNHLQSQHSLFSQPGRAAQCLRPLFSTMRPNKLFDRSTGDFLLYLCFLLDKNACDNLC